MATHKSSIAGYIFSRRNRFGVHCWGGGAVRVILITACVSSTTFSRPHLRPTDRRMRAAAIQLNSPLHAARIAASQARVAGMRRAVGASAFARPAAFSAAESRAGASGPRFYAASHSPPSAAGEGRHGQRDGSDILWLVGSLAIFFPFLYYLTEPTPKKVSGERTRGSSSRFKNEQAKKAAEPATTEAEVSPSADASAEAEAPVENPVEENGVADETDSSAVEVEADASFSETPVDEVAEQPASVTGTESESEPKPVDVEDASEGAAPAETSNEETSFPYVIVGYVSGHDCACSLPDPFCSLVVGRLHSAPKRPSTSFNPRRKSSLLAPRRAVLT